MKDHKVNGVMPTPEGVYVALNDNFGKNIIAQLSGNIKGGTISLGDTISFDWKACGCGMALNKSKEIEVALTVLDINLTPYDIRAKYFPDYPG